MTPTSATMARRHHYVPRCYLNGFAAPRRKKRQVVVFDRIGGKCFVAVTDNVAVEKDFNRVQLEGHSPDAFETGMAKFEGELAPALERIITAGSLSNDEDRIYLMNLIGVLALRNPRWRENWRNFEERVAKAMMQALVSTPQLWANHVRKARAAGYLTDEHDTNYDKMREFVRSDGFTIEIPTERHIVLEMEGLDTVLLTLMDRKWALLKTPDASGGFITSDHPVCLMWSDPQERGRNRLRPPGHGMQRTQIVFPLCTKYAMIGTFEGDGRERDVDESMIAAINRTVIAYSRRQVYARDMHFTYTGDARAEQRKASRLASESWFRWAESDDD